MDHAEFVAACKDDSRKIYITRAKALRAVSEGYLPKRYQYAHLFWSWIWFLSYPAGIAIMIFQKWWVGLIFLIFIPWFISSGVKKSAFDFIVEHAIENPDFYVFAIDNGIIRID